MKSYIFRNAVMLAALISSLALANPAYADCASPTGVEGEQVYNTTYKTMQFCDGNYWYSMKGFDGPTYSGVDGQIGFYSGEQLVFSSGIFLSSSGNVGIGTESPGQKMTVTGTVESTSGGFKFPDGTTQTTAASGGGPYTGSLVNSIHTGQQCLESGGYPVEAGSGVNVCKFGHTSFITFNHAGGSDATCPNGWTQYLNWTTTVPRTCTNANSCTTGSHVWANQTQETCEYVYFGWQSGDPLAVCTAAKYYVACY